MCLVSFVGNMVDAHSAHDLLLLILKMNEDVG